jgi:hypothetical protein
MPRYDIIAEESPSRTARLVSDALDDGGRLHGGLKVIKDDGGKLVFVQAVFFP